MLELGPELLEVAGDRLVALGRVGHDDDVDVRPVHFHHRLDVSERRRVEHRRHAVGAVAFVQGLEIVAVSTALEATKSDRGC